MRHTGNAGKSSPIHRLYLLVDEIVAGIRQGMVTSGVRADAAAARTAEIRAPIILKGTDLRVTIEAGPSIAARNAIHSAQMAATDEPVADPRGDAVREAMALLAEQAAVIMDSNRNADGTWDDEQERRIFDRMARCVRRLDAMQSDMR